MRKNILVITGSPRKGGNSDMMAEAFINGARTAGHMPVKYEAAFSKISGCRACDTCWSKNVPCTFNDDFNNQFVPLLERTDALVFSMPLYFYGFPSSVQATLEKLYSLLGENSPMKMKVSEAALMMCAGESDPDVFGGAVATYQRICNGLNWNNRGTVLAPGVLGKGAIAESVYLIQAEALGRTI